MRHELHIWRSEAGSRRWLSMLVAAMEETARPELRCQRPDSASLDQLRAQLALPASLLLYQAPTSSLRH